MNERTMTLNEIREVGVTALTKALGPAGAIRFLQQFQTGSGDYTAGRRKMLGNPAVDELLQELKQKRRTKTPRRSKKT